MNGCKHLTLQYRYLKSNLHVLNQTIKHIVSTLLFTAGGAALLIWIYRGFDFRPVADIFTQRSNHLWIILTLLAGIVANVLRAFRWRMLLHGAEIRLGRRRAVELVFISYLINSITPRLGELTRALLVRRGNSKVSARAFGTIIIEKIADVACLLIVVLTAVVFRWSDTVGLMSRTFDRMQAALPSYTLYIIIGAVLCLAVGLTLPRIRHFRSLLCNLWQGISAIVHLQRPWAFVGLCAGIWGCNFLQLALLLPCFAELSHLSWLDAFHVFAAASIGVLLPTPSGAGPWHFMIVKTLTAAHQVPAATAKSIALVSHGLKTALVMLLGLLAYVTFYWEMWTRRYRKGRGATTTNT